MLLPGWTRIPERKLHRPYTNENREVSECELRLRNSRQRAGLRLHGLAHELFYLRPQTWIALALHVAGSEDLLEPRCPTHTIHRMLLIIKEVVAQDLGFGVI